MEEKDVEKWAGPQREALLGILIIDHFESVS